MANSVDPDQMPHSVVSDLGLHYMQRPISPKSKGYYGIQAPQVMAYVQLGLLSVSE